jgi:hypothetical protein
MKSLLGGIEAGMIHTLGKKFDVENVFEEEDGKMVLVTIIKFDGVILQRHELDLMPMYEAFEKRIK